MSKVRIGIIGAGGIVQIQHLPFLKGYEEVELVSICDIDRDKAGAVAQKFQIPHFHRQAEDLLVRKDIDAVLICTPNNCHLPMVLAALENEKHVLVEVPISRNYSEAKRMIEAAEKADKILMVALNYRFRPDSIIMKNFISEGELGEVFLIRAGLMKRMSESSLPAWKYDPRLAGGGVLMDLGIQMLDLCLWLIDFPPLNSVDTRTFDLISKNKTEDQASVFLKIEGGRLIAVDVGRNLPSQQNISYTVIHGEKGTAWLNPLRIHRELHGQTMELNPGRQFTPLELYNRSYENEVKHFVESIKYERQSLVNESEILTVMKLVELSYSSAKEGKEMIFEDEKVVAIED
jgi:predicted dehydrogenase